MSVYIHGTDDDEQRRLSLMNDVLLNSAMLREMNLRGDERILDLGSGLGQFTRMMARAVPNGTRRRHRVQRRAVVRGEAPGGE